MTTTRIARIRLVLLAVAAAMVLPAAAQAYWRGGVYLRLPADLRGAAAGLLLSSAGLLLSSGAGVRAGPAGLCHAARRRQRSAGAGAGLLCRAMGVPDGASRHQRRFLLLHGNNGRVWGQAR